MTNPDLAAILRRFYALVAASMLPAGALLLSTGRREAAVGLGFGALIATLNAAMLAGRISRAAAVNRAQAQQVMQQGMGVRFALILLATVVTVKMAPSAIPAFLLGLAITMALMVAVAARALLGSVEVREPHAARALGLKRSLYL